MSLIDHFSCGELIANRYHLDIRIHEGRWGDIFQATDQRDDRTVAIRFFPAGPEMGDGGSFLSHARRLSGFKAPGMSVPTDQGIFEGVPFTVNRWARGTPLEDEIAERGRFTPEQTLLVLKELLSALAEAHELRLVHGLLRPSKIVVQGLEEGAPRLTVVDFQIWKLFELSSGQTAFAEKNLSRRIVRYAGPEVIQKHHVIPPTDVYAVGLLSIEMLKGSPALEGNDRIALIAQQLDPDPLDLSDLEISSNFRQFLGMLLAKDPHDRISSAAEALDILKQQRRAFLASADDATAPPQIPDTPEDELLDDDGDVPLMSNFDEELFGKDPSEVDALGTDHDDLGSDFQPTGFFGDDDEEDAEIELGSPAPAPAASLALQDPLDFAGSEHDDEEGLDFDSDAPLELDIDEPDPNPSASGAAARPAPHSPAAASLSHGPGQGPPLPPKVSNNRAIFGSLLFIAFVVAVFVFSNSDDDPGEVPDTDETVETARTVAIDEYDEDDDVATHTLVITTNPPAITVQIRGRPNARSPVTLEVREDEFPLAIRARMDANNVIETEVTHPQDTLHIDFTE